MPQSLAMLSGPLSHRQSNLEYRKGKWLPTTRRKKKKKLLIAFGFNSGDLVRVVPLEMSIDESKLIHLVVCALPFAYCKFISALLQLFFFPFGF